MQAPEQVHESYEVHQQKERHTARGIVVRDGKVLLMERWRHDPETGLARHYFSIPGGGIDQGESAPETAVREVEEETTIKVRVRELALEQERPHGGTNIYFICDYVSGEPQLNPEGPEALHYANENNQFLPRWVSPEELHGVSLAGYEDARAIIDQVLSQE